MSQAKTQNIMIVGVGGQGTVLAGKLLGRLLLDQGYDVKISEVHGMSQRGGSVVTFVRFGESVASPIIDKGEADYIVSFEPLEAARNLEFLKPGGTIITSTQVMPPMSVIAGSKAYPEDLMGKFAAKGAVVDVVDALELAQQAGTSKAANIVLMGRLSLSFPEMPEEAWRKALSAVVPAKVEAVNQAAFGLGRGE